MSTPTLPPLPSLTDLQNQLTNIPTEIQSQLESQLASQITIPIYNGGLLGSIIIIFLLSLAVGWVYRVAIGGGACDIINACNRKT